MVLSSCQDQNRTFPIRRLNTRLKPLSGAIRLLDLEQFDLQPGGALDGARRPPPRDTQACRAAPEWSDFVFPSLTSPFAFICVPHLQLPGVRVSPEPKTPSGGGCGTGLFPDTRCRPERLPTRLREDSRRLHPSNSTVVPQVRTPSGKCAAGCVGAAAVSLAEVQRPQIRYCTA